MGDLKIYKPKLGTMANNKITVMGHEKYVILLLVNLL